MATSEIRILLGKLLTLDVISALAFLAIISGQIANKSPFAPWVVPIEVVMILECIFLSYLVIISAPPRWAVKLLFVFCVLSSFYVVLPIAWSSWAIGTIRFGSDGCYGECHGFIQYMYILTIFPLVFFGYRLHVLIQLNLPPETNVTSHSHPPSQMYSIYFPLAPLSLSLGFLWI